MSRNVQDLEILAREMGITAEEIELRKQFLEIGEADIALLGEIHDHIEHTHFDDVFTDLFYQHLRAFPDLHRFIPDDATVAKLRAVQSQYFRRLTAGEYGEEYVVDRLRVGYVHQQIGLKPKWYTGAYRKYLSYLLSVLHELQGNDRDKFLASFDALLKMVFFDMELALDTYLESDRQDLSHMANHDQLTGLPNRYLLDDRIEQAIHQAHREKKQLAILFVDLDRFKIINDSLGHAVGDAVISTAASRFADALREGDTIARLGGDEFVVVLPDIEHAEHAEIVTRKLLASIAQPIEVGGREFYVTASIGIAVYPQDGANQNALLKNADTAMYKAKQEGGNTCHFYHQQMNVQSSARLSMEASLHHALDNREFLLHYQPQIDLQTGQIVGVEALLRWKRDDIMVAPSAFIPIAEETGIIIPIGEWVLETACRQAAAWKSLGITDVPMKVAVNLSARQFWGRDIEQVVLGALARSGCEPSCLELEITETVAMKHPEDVADTLKRLAGVGVSISIDDFGTGYSSLAYLKQFPVHALKIDRTFVQNIFHDRGDAAIVRAVIALAHGLGIKVVAEGVEDESQFEFLRKVGCDFAQGHYHSHPMPADEITRLLLPYGVLKQNSQRKKIIVHDDLDAAVHASVPNINRCRVQWLDPARALCVANDSQCRFSLPFGNLCGHPWVEQIAKA